jgi:hypothetical protein
MADRVTLDEILTATLEVLQLEKEHDTGGDDAAHFKVILARDGIDSADLIEAAERLVGGLAASLRELHPGVSDAEVQATARGAYSGFFRGFAAALQLQRREQRQPPATGA